MRAQPAEQRTPLSRAVAALTDEQDGAIARSQLLALGASRSSIEARLASGRWQRLFAGTYVTFTGPVPFRTRVSAALLRVGEGAMAWGRTAAALDGLADESGGPVHVLVPASRRVVVEPAIVVRRSRHAAGRAHPSRTPRRTRIEHTVLDLSADAEGLVQVGAWVSRAVGRRLTTPDRLLQVLESQGRHRWRTELVAVLRDVALGAQSPLEVAYLRNVERAHALPAGVRQHRLAGRSVRWVDVDVEPFSVRIELDGRLGHADEGAFRDRRRDNDATRAGHATLRYGWTDVFGTPCEVASEVAAVLVMRGWRGRPRPCGPACDVDRGGSDRL
ncbi:MAG: hypothetical protein ACJ71T_06420 [Actinomycetales bacterium]